MNDEGSDMMGRVLKLQRQLETGRQVDPTEPLPAWTVDDMLNLEPPTWVIDGVLQAGTRFMLFAPSGHHKTNLAVDAACLACSTSVVAVSRPASTCCFSCSEETSPM